MSYRNLKKKWIAEGEIPEWYSTNSLQFFMQKYSYKGESVRSRLNALASYLAKYAPPVKPDWWEEDPYTKGKDWEEVFFNLNWDGYAVPSTPLLANAGVPDRGMTVSCSGQDLQNSIASKSFMIGELEQLIKNAHGCSTSLEAWLAEGDVYDSDGNISEGVIPIIQEIQNKTASTNQGIRRGQTLIGIGAEHGDFWKVASYLEDHSADLNIAWIIRDSFIEKLKNEDEEILQRLARMIQLRMKTGKGYFTKVDTMNRNKAEVFKRLNMEVKGSNLCVAPETKVLTKEGYFPIVELEGQKVEIWNGQEWSSVDIVKTGEDQKLITVELSSGEKIECTPYHKFYVQNTYSSTSVVMKQASELKEGDKLIKFELPVVQGEKELPYAYENGFFTGDGTIVNGNSVIYLYGDKLGLEPILKGVERIYDNPKDSRKVVYMNEGVLKDKFFVPSNGYTVQSRLDWLAGLSDADGTIAVNGVNSSLQICSIQKEFLLEVQLMLQTLGVRSKVSQNAKEGLRSLPKNDGSGENGLYSCKDAYRLLISSNGLFKLTQLGFKTNRLTWDHRLPQREAEQFSKVVSVKDEGRVDDSFCFTEPKRNMGMFNGVLTGNCNEVNLPVTDKYSFTCVIYNANLLLWDKFPKHFFQLLHIMQDCNVSGYLEQIDTKKGLSRLFLNRVYEFTKDFRAVGSGVCGFHSLLMEKEIAVGDIESYQLNAEIFSKMQEETHKANVWLANVMGVPDGIKRSGLHLRNATTMFAPPTKSSTELAYGSPSEGVGMQTGMVKVKESTGGDLMRIESSFLKVMKRYGKYNQAEVNRIAQNKGSVQNLEWLPDHLKRVYRVGFEVPMEAHLNLCSQRQPYFDQQQSINLWLSGGEDEEYIGEIHKQALLDDNINGLYYCYSTRGGVFTRIKECEVCQ